jgi:hypothetical protein
MQIFEYLPSVNLTKAPIPTPQCGRIYQLITPLVLEKKIMHLKCIALSWQNVSNLSTLGPSRNLTHAMMAPTPFTEAKYLLLLQRNQVYTDLDYLQQKLLEMVISQGLPKRAKRVKH